MNASISARAPQRSWRRIPQSSLRAAKPRGNPDAELDRRGADAPRDDGDRAQQRLEPDSLGLNRHSSESWNLFAFPKGMKRKAGFQLSLE
jgi:hypothetical protein